jgi:hypothetical protein
MAMLLSYLVPKDRRFSLRWLFGLGVVLATVGIGTFSTAHRQHLSEYTFSGTRNLYRGIVTDSPQEKAKTVAYRVFLPDEDKQVVCYFQRDSLISERLYPGMSSFFMVRFSPSEIWESG